MAADRLPELVADVVAIADRLGAARIHLVGHDWGGVVAAPRVGVATLYVWGSGDAALGPSAAVTTARWVTGAYRFEVLPGAGHWLPEHHAEQLGRLLLEHLRR